MNNTKLIFKHQIPIELFAETNTALTVLINNEVCFKKNYPENNKYKEVIEFEKEYSDGAKNTISFLFTGEQEVEKKSLKILQIGINDQMLNLFNAEYFPKLNQEWWEQLNDSDKKKYNERIYGTMGSEFGWYGEINFYYCCGVDLRTKFGYNNSDVNNQVLHERLNWIYLDESSVRGYHKTAQRDKTK
tara:strand:- start:7 stop:570 length:564 start_codon:yes stop_codon:yes gene_type:complete